jgi:hypothetical protein
MLQINRSGEFGRPPQRRTGGVVLSLLVDHFGDFNQAIDLMRAFAGQVIKVPENEVIERLANQQRIADRLSDDPSEGNVRRVSQFLGIESRAVVKTFAAATGVSIMDARHGTAIKLEALIAPRRRKMIIRAPRRIRDVAGQFQMFSPIPS